MPYLPQYNSKRNIQPKLATPVKSGAGQLANDVQGVLSGAEKVVNTWNKAVDTMQYTQAKTEYQVRSADIYSRASLDPDYNNSAKYFEELDQAKKDTMEGFTNEAMATRFATEVDGDNRLNNIKIDHMFKKKMLDFSVGELERGVSSLENQAAMNGDDSKLSDINALIDENVASGIISKDAGEDAKLKSAENVKAGIIQNMIWTDPEQAKSEIAKSKELTPEEKKKYIGQAGSLAESREKAADFETYRIETATSSELSRALLDGKLTPSMVDAGIQSGVIGSQVAKAYYRSLTDYDYEGKEGAGQIYTDFLMEALADGSNAQDIVLKATEAFRVKTIGVNEFAYFLDYADGMLKEEVAGEPKKPNSLNSLINAAGNSGGSNSIRSMMQKIAGGTEPRQALAEVRVEKVIADDPSLATEEDPVDTSYRKQAIEILKSNGYPVVEGNIKATMDQLKGAE